MRERKNTITRTIQEEDNNRKEDAKMEKKKKTNRKKKRRGVCNFQTWRTEGGSKIRMNERKR